MDTYNLWGITCRKERSVHKTLKRLKITSGNHILVG